MTSKAGIGALVTEEHELGTIALDLFTRPEIEGTQIAGRPQTIYMHTPISDAGPFEFIIPSDSNDYISLDQTTLYGEVQVKKTDNTDFADGDIVSIINNFPQTLFRQVEVYLNNVCVSDLSTPTYAYKAFIENHLTYDDDIKSTTLRAKEMYIKDIIGSEGNITNALKVEGGFKARREKMKNKICFDMKLHCDFLGSQRYLIPGVEMKIKLIRNDDAFSLMSTKNDYKISMNKLELNIRKVVVEPQISHAIENKLSSEPALYPIANSKIRTYLINSGIQSQHIAQIIRGKLPRSFLFGLVPAKAFDGDITYNPFQFKHYDVNYLNVFINGEPIHPKAITPQWDNDECLPQYTWMLNNIGLHQNFSNGLTLGDFKSNSCFFAYDLSPDLCNSTYMHHSEQGVVDISISFKTALAENVYVVLYATYNDTVLIDKNRNVTIV